MMSCSVLLSVVHYEEKLSVDLVIITVYTFYNTLYIPQSLYMSNALPFWTELFTGHIMYDEWIRPGKVPA